MNRHLNLFTFYNDHQQEYIENNLSRAFALCLRNSPLFLDKILQRLLPEGEYEKLFSLDFSLGNIQINLQQNIDDLGIFRRIIGVGCSGMEFPDYTNVDAKTLDKPIPDVSIVIGDVALVFEFKSNDSDPRPQVRNQVKAILGRMDGQECLVDYADLCWTKIVGTILNVLSLYQQAGNSNTVLQDFRVFLELQFPNWFPVFPLGQINAPPKSNRAHPDWKHIGQRLNHLKQEVYGKDAMNFVPGQFSRYIIAQHWGWAKEQHVDIAYREGKPYIIVAVYPGDTKRQGLKLFAKGSNYTEWPDNIAGFRLLAHPYLKFSHFNSGLFWFDPEWTEAEKTHHYDFFDDNAGRWKKEQWPKFEELMAGVAPNWKARCGYTPQLEHSNRSYFDLSMGILLEVLIPYESARTMDAASEPQGGENKLLLEIRQILDELKGVVDGKAAGGPTPSS